METNGYALNNLSQFEKKVKAGLSDDEIEKIQYGNEYINEALYFLFEKGFYIEIDKETIRHFVPFESSASMSRNSRVSFIDQSIKNRLDNRLMLGMDFTFGSDNKADYVAVPAHKYFANLAGLIEIDVWVTAQLIDGECVDIKLCRVSVADAEVG